MLNQNFFSKPAPLIAKALLGKCLVRKIGNKKIRLVIAETEAYDGPKDKASHASRGKTERNKTMFEQAGCFYIYFTYGMHYMLNIVTGPKNYPAAVLIRGGIVCNSNHLPLVACHMPHFINGPAKLTKFLKISKKFNGLKSIPKNKLWFEDCGINLDFVKELEIRPKAPKNKKFKVIAKKRVGVEYAGKTWANKKYNFSLDFKIQKMRYN